MLSRERSFRDDDPLAALGALGDVEAGMRIDGEGTMTGGETLRCSPDTNGLTPKNDATAFASAGDAATGGGGVGARGELHKRPTGCVGPGELLGAGEMTTPFIAAHNEARGVQGLCTTSSPSPDILLNRVKHSRPAENSSSFFRMNLQCIHPSRHSSLDDESNRLRFVTGVIESIGCVCPSKSREAYSGELDNKSQHRVQLALQ